MVLTLKQFVREFEKVVQQANTNTAVKLLNTPCKDMEEYKRNIGRAEGMTNAVGLARDMLQKLDEDDERNSLPEMKNVGGSK